MSAFSDALSAGEGRGLETPVPAMEPAPRRASRRQRPRPWRVIIFVLAGIYFIGPQLAAFKFSLVLSSGKYGFGNYGQIVQNSALRDSLFTSLEISAITAVVVVALVLPTVVWVRLKAPRLTLLLEGITILPIVIPPVVMAAGLEQLEGHSPQWLVNLVFNHALTGLTPFYVILALPFSYRAIDTGVRAIDLRTLVDASRSLGASSFSTLTRVILPNVQTAVLGAVFLTVALCLGEVVIATILLYVTFPVELIQVGQETGPGVQVALSILSFLFVFGLLFALSFLAGRRRGATSTRLI
jgi:putative spermidine/putrescine transport system permease protein